MKKLIFAVPFLVLAACETTMEADSSGGPAPAVADGGDLNGTYDPSVTTAEQVKEAVRAQCASGSIKHYVEGPGDGGMMVYTARCV